MKMRYGFAVVLLAQAAVAAPGVIFVDPDHLRQSALRLCAREYPTDFTMQGACRRNFEAGASSYDKIAERYAHVPEMQLALHQCIRDYSDGSYIDYAMLGACARNQEQGYLEMRR